MNRLLTLALVTLTACASTEELGEREHALGCTKFYCGGNGPMLGGMPFHELDMRGREAAPETGVRIVKFVDSADVPMTVDVQGFELRGRTPGNVLVTGAALVGATLTIEAPDLTRYLVTIDSVIAIQRYYEDGDDGTLIPSYGMSVTVEGGFDQPRPLCPRSVESTLMFQAGPYDALIYRGDRYDPLTGEVYATGTAAGTWFNVACVGDAGAKALVMRHGEAAQGIGFRTRPAQRTALVRLFRADYCGDGSSQTQAGVLIDFAHAGGWNDLDQALTPLNIEAIWDANGAVCLSQKRLAGAVLPCRAPPPCTAAQIAAPFAHGHAVSIIP